MGIEPQETECRRLGTLLDSSGREICAPYKEKMKTVNYATGPLEWTLLVTLSILWGGSFFFVGVAVNGLPPFTIVVLRVGAGRDRAEFDRRRHGAAHAGGSSRVGCLFRHGLSQQPRSV